ncbi:MAG: hypothetical protein WCT18_03200 [Patescibacteria group bacterium]
MGKLLNAMKGGFSSGWRAGSGETETAETAYADILKKLSDSSFSDEEIATAFLEFCSKFKEYSYNMLAIVVDQISVFRPEVIMLLDRKINNK